MRAPADPRSPGLAVPLALLALPAPAAAQTPTNIVSRTVTVEAVAADEGSPSAVVSRELSVEVAPELSQPTGIVSRPLSVRTPTADLVARSIDAPTGAVIGGIVLVEWTVENEGWADAVAPWTDEVVLAYDPFFDEEESVVLGSFPSPADLPSGESYQRSLNVTIPGSFGPGVLHIGVVVDAGNMVPEPGEKGDNVLFAPLPVVVTSLPQPDLAVTSVVAPPVALDGAATTVEYRVDNLGTAAAAPMWTDEVWLSYDPFLGDDTLLDATVHVGPLGAGEGYTAQRTVVIPPEEESGFDRWFIVRTNVPGLPDDAFDENDVRVAAASTLVTQSHLPDLRHAFFDEGGPQITTELDELFGGEGPGGEFVGGGGGGGGVLYPGLAATLTWAVENFDVGEDGKGTASGPWIDEVYVEADGVIGPGDQPVATASFDGVLAPFHGTTLQATFDLPPQPGFYTLFVVIDSGDDVAEGAGEGNNVFSTPIFVSEPPYSASVHTDFVAGLASQAPGQLVVTLQGTATDLEGGAPVPNAFVHVVVRNQGTRYVFDVFTDGQGDYAFPFEPLVGQAGTFDLFAHHPAVVEDPVEDVQDSFLLQGLAVEPASVVTSLTAGQSAIGQATVTNLSDVLVGGIAASVAGLPGHLALNDLSVPSTLGPNQSATITWTLAALADAPDPAAPADVRVDLTVPLPFTGPVLATSLALPTYVTPNAPVLEADVAVLDTPLILGELTPLALTVTNVGGAPATGVRVSAPCLKPASTGYYCPIDDLLSLWTPEELGVLAPGESRRIELAAILPPETPEGSTWDGVSLDVVAAETALEVPISFVSTDSPLGSITVAVEDELTYYDFDGTPLFGAGPRVEGALVEIVGASAGPHLSATTEGDGLATLEPLPAGLYRLRVTADGHGEHETLVELRAGEGLSATAFLPTRIVEYALVGEADGSTSVLVQQGGKPFLPTIRVEPTLIELDPDETKHVTLEIFNEGQLTALDVELVMEPLAGYDVVLPAGQLGDLGPFESIEVPVAIVPTGATGACSDSASWGVRSGLLCGDYVSYWWPLFWEYPASQCGGLVAGGCPPDACGPGGGSPLLMDLGSAAGVAVASDTDCTPAPAAGDLPPPHCRRIGRDHACATSGGPAAQGSGAYGGGRPRGAGSAGPLAIETEDMNSVFLFSGEKVERVVDLRIPGRGIDFVWERTYRSKLPVSSVQGIGWDFGYNLRIERAGVDLRLHGGDGRVETFALGADDSWSRAERFERIVRNADGSYTLERADRGRLEFKAIDEFSFLSGRLEAVVDRAGNRLTLTYEGEAQEGEEGEFDPLVGEGEGGEPFEGPRLLQVTDTLGRDVTIDYGPDGRIASITDFDGRQVLYEYYQLGDAGGSPGDLKSVTRPAVVDTPNGNDFPLGKTTVYTYSTGFQQEELNHNLLTIQDARGIVYEQNVYGFAFEPSEEGFDRLVQQRWGNPGDLIDLHYVPLVPSTLNGGAVLRTIVNDRLGNVVEHEFDARNRRVRTLEYTGRAPDPDGPTTLTQNRPVGPLRHDDPPFFETRYEYNDDSLLTSVREPNGNEVRYVYEGDLDADAATRVRGNLREVHYLRGDHGTAGDHEQLIERFEYHPDAGDCCGESWLARYVDAEDQETLHEVDAAGNRTRTVYPVAGVEERWEYDAHGQVLAHVWPDNGSGHLQRDRFDYYVGGPARGYLERVVEDEEGFGLTTSYEYDLRGNPTRIVDPRGNDTLYAYNALDQLVVETSPLVEVDGSLARFETRYHYDANDNLIRREVDDLGSGPEESGEVVTTWSYETLNRVDFEEREVGGEEQEEEEGGGPVAMAYQYDAARNLALVSRGEAIAEEQIDNVVRLEHDERGLLFRATRGFGGPAPSVSERDYDGNRNLVRERSGLGGPGTPSRVTEHGYDAFSRRIETVDAMGNRIAYAYDGAGRVVGERREGEISDEYCDFGGGGPGGGPCGDEGPGESNIRLAELSRVYDEMGRLLLLERHHFETPSQTPIGDGLSVTELEYTARSGVEQVIDDNGRVTETVFDGLGRPALVTDPRGNTRSYLYDEGSNLVSLTEVDLSDGGAAAQAFVTGWTYDALGRPLSRTDNAGGTRRWSYDTRGNVVGEEDELGNLLVRIFDAADREIRTEWSLTDTGDGAGAVLDTVATTRRWDASSRVIARADDMGHETTFEYDGLDRLVRIDYADGTAETFVYDEHDDIRQHTDANGTVVTATYDTLGRPVARSIAPGPGVDAATTYEELEYDGLSRLVGASNDATGVFRRFDSLSNCLEELQEEGAVRRTFDGVGNPVRLEYPGGRTIDRTFDALDRPSELLEGGQRLARILYVGRDRVEGIEYGSGHVASLAYDLARRPVAQGLAAPFGGGPIDDRTFAWNAAGDRTGISDLLNGWDASYEYDSGRRLVRSTRTQAAATVSDVAYTLDRLANRLQVSGGAMPGVYVLDGTWPTPADAQMNQYTSVPGRSLEYDANGNLVVVRDAAGGAVLRTYAYDHANRLVEVDLPVDGVTIRYVRDALGRVVRRESTDGRDDVVEHFLYDGDVRIEELDELSGATTTYATAGGLGSVLEQQRAAGLSEYLYRDVLGSTLRVVREDGQVLSSIEYDEYGAPLDPQTWTPWDLGGLATTALFTGLHHDPATGLVGARHRELDPSLGRFTTRDPSGPWRGPDADGNELTYAGANPLGRTHRHDFDRSAPARRPSSTPFPSQP